MVDQGLREKLEELQAELRRADSPDEREREMLRGLEADVGDLLAREADAPPQYDGLGGRLKEAVARLEASHPEATLLMRQVIDSLAYMGI
jgi:hypothetical protein